MNSSRHKWKCINLCGLPKQVTYGFMWHCRLPGLSTFFTGLNLSGSLPKLAENRTQRNTCNQLPGLEEYVPRVLLTQIDTWPGLGAPDARSSKKNYGIQRLSHCPVGGGCLSDRKPLYSLKYDSVPDFIESVLWGVGLDSSMPCTARHTIK